MKINRNIAWAETFVKELVAGGVKYACISPGSRNTPLTWAFAQNKKIKKYVHIDERSSAFFAMGLANRTGTPVALVCTSGTASVEFYAAIVEAYLQRIPMIVCTADRPAELRHTGTNQTINQDNLYKNHIRWFADVGLPELTVNKLANLKGIAGIALKVSCFGNKGPVQINFPFRKPFEPDTFTDDINSRIESFLNKTFYKPEEKNSNKKLRNNRVLAELAGKFLKLKKGLIIVGPENYGSEFRKQVYRLSNLLGYPLLADGTSQLRYSKQNISHDNLICNYEAIFRSQEFINNNAPEVIIHFGRTPTSRGMEDFYENHSPIKIIVNAEGDVFDPSRKGKVYEFSPQVFCISICDIIAARNKIQMPDRNWIDIYKEADKGLEQLKREIFSTQISLSEPGIVNEFLKEVPEYSTIMLSNSLPVRDFDFFASRCPKSLTIFHNRGASGIDGIISTALGIASAGKGPVFLITGDVAFYYDINALLNAKKYNIPLTVLLINNNGGGIFNSLPISRYRQFIEEYFVTSHNLDFKKLTQAFEIKYNLVTRPDKFRELLRNTPTADRTRVVEIRTDSQKSLALRNNYWKESQSFLKTFVKSHISE